jgi:hypothetical protein
MVSSLTPILVGRVIAFVIALPAYLVLRLSLSDTPPKRLPWNASGPEFAWKLRRLEKSGRSV